MASGQPFLHIPSPIADVAEIGPLVIPGKTPCIRCAHLSRQEPCGVWGGQLIEDGVIIERKRRAGRPPRQVIAAARMVESVNGR